MHYNYIAQFKEHIQLSNMVYHSVLAEQASATMCNCPILPLRDSIRGPAPNLEPPSSDANTAQEDIVDEVGIWVFDVISTKGHHVQHHQIVGNHSAHTPSTHSHIYFLIHIPHTHTTHFQALRLFRANVLFRSFDVANSADRLLVYLTLYTSVCLKRMVVLGGRPTSYYQALVIALPFNPHNTQPSPLTQVSQTRNQIAAVPTISCTSSHMRDASCQESLGFHWVG